MPDLLDDILSGKVTSSPKKSGGYTAEEVDSLISGDHGQSVRALFDTVKWAEGGQPDLIVGGQKRFDPNGDHPNIVGLTTSAGPSTAAGDYQITGSNWNGTKGRPGLKARLRAENFNADNQYRAAVMLANDAKEDKNGKLLRGRGEFAEAVARGDIERARAILAQDWTSTPGSTIGGGGQKKHENWNQKLEQNIGVQKERSGRLDSILFGDQQNQRLDDILAGRTDDVPTSPGAAPAAVSQDSDVIKELQLTKQSLERELKTAKRLRDKKKIQQSIKRIDVSIAEETKKRGANWQTPAAVGNPSADGAPTAAATPGAMTIVPNQIAPGAQPRQYGRRDVSKLPAGTPAYAFEQTGKINDQLEYLGTEGGKFYGQNADGDEFVLDEATKQFKPLGAIKRQLDGSGREYLRRDDVRGSGGETIYASDGDDFVFGQDGIIKPVSPFTKTITLQNGKKLTRTEKTETGAKYVDDKNVSYIADNQGLREEFPAKRPLELSDKKSGQQFVEQDNQENLKPNETRLADVKTGEDYIAVAQTDQKGVATGFSIMREADRGKKVGAQRRVVPTAGGTMKPVSVATADNQIGATPEAAPPVPEEPQESTANDFDLNTSFERAVGFENKPENISNRDWAIEQLIPQLTTALNVEAVDVEKALRKHLVDVKGYTPLDQLTKDQKFVFEMTEDFYLKILNQSNSKRAGLNQIVATGRELSAEEKAKLGKEYGISPQEMESAFDGSNINYKEAFNQGQATKQIFQGFLKSRKSEAAANGDPETIADIQAAADVGWIDRTKADELIGNERAAYRKWLSDNRSSAQDEADQLRVTAFEGAPRKSSLSESDIAGYSDKVLEERRNDIISAYGGFDRYFKEQERIKAEYGDFMSATRPLARPLEFAKGFGAAVPQALSSALKYVDIVREVAPMNAYDMYRFVSGNPFQATEGYAHQIGEGIDHLTEQWMPKNRDLSDYYAAGNALGQVAVQMTAGVLSGGAIAPVMLGSAMGAAEQNEEARKAGATNAQRRMVTIVAGVAAISDAIPFAKFLRPLGKVERLGWLNRYINSVFTNAAKEVGEKQAEVIARGAFRQMFVSAAKNAKTLGIGFFLEGTQELTEKKINDLAAALTYDPKRKVFTITKEDRHEFIFGGIGGIGGGGAEIAIEQAVENKAQNLSFEIPNLENFQTSENNTAAPAQTVPPATAAPSAQNGSTAAVENAPATDQIQPNQKVEFVDRKTGETVTGTVKNVKGKVLSVDVEGRDKPIVIKSDKVNLVPEETPAAEIAGEQSAEAAPTVKETVKRATTPAALAPGRISDIKGQKGKAQPFEFASAQNAETPNKAGTTPETSNVVSFKTEKGSVYTVNGQSTQRDKSFHPEHGAQDVGVKEPSEITYYAENAESLAKLVALEADKKRVIVEKQPNGDIYAVPAFWNPKEGKLGVTSADRANPVKLTTVPAKGLSPVELWKSEAPQNGRTSYRGLHVGNKIVELTTSNSQEQNESTQPLEFRPKKSVDEIFAGEKTHLREVLEASNDFEQAYNRGETLQKEITDLKRRKSSAAKENKKAIQEQIDEKQAEIHYITAQVQKAQNEFGEQLLDKLTEIAREKGHDVTADDRDDIAEYAIPYLTDGRYMENVFNELSVQELSAELIDDYYSGKSAVTLPSQNKTQQKPAESTTKNENAGTQSHEKSPAAKTRTVEVNGKTITLTPEQETRWKNEIEPIEAKNKKRFDSKMEMARRAEEKGDNMRAGVIREDANREAKGDAMQLAALKREVAGALTVKEQAKKAKHDKSNYLGKAVSVDGRNAKVVGNPFGKVKVQFEDGTEKTVAAENVGEPVEAKKAENTTNYRFSSTQANLSGKNKQQVLALGKSLIADADLAADGRDLEPHVTVLWGIHTQNAEELREIIESVSPFEITLGKVSIFKGKKDVDYDVVKVEIVDSPELHALNKLLAEKVKNTQTFPDYKPHVTLAYVKKGKGKKYAGSTKLAGTKISIDEIVFSSQTKEKTTIELKGVPEAIEATKTEKSAPNFQTKNGREIDVLDIEVLIETFGTLNISHLQRHLSLGYGDAASIVPQIRERFGDQSVETLPAQKITIERPAAGEKKTSPAEALSKSIDVIFDKINERAQAALDKEQGEKFKSVLAGLETDPKSVDELELDEALTTAEKNNILPDFVEHLRGKDLIKHQIDQVNDWITDLKLQNSPLEFSATAAAHDAATSPLNDLPEPTHAQKEAGNYKKGHINIAGVKISVENPIGSERSGTDPDGKAWSIKMQHHYGDIEGSIGADGEPIDIFVKDETPADYSGDVFIVDQNNPATGKFDEHKVMLGFADETEARAAYLSNYDKNWKGLNEITTMPIAQFKAWAKEEQRGAAAKSESAASSDLFSKTRALYEKKLQQREYPSPNSNVFVRTNADGSFKAAGLYVDNNWQEFTDSQAIENSQSDYQAVKKSWDKDKSASEILSSDLAEKINRLVDKIGANEFEKLLEKFSWEERGTARDFSREGKIAEWLLNNQNKTDSITKIVDDALSSSVKGKSELPIAAAVEPSVSMSDIFERAFEKNFGKTDQERQQDEVLSELGDLFGFDAGVTPEETLKSARVADETIDEELYEKTAPVLEKALTAFGTTGDVQEAMNNLLKTLAERVPVEKIREMKPYIVRFMEEKFLPKTEKQSKTSEEENENAQSSEPDTDGDRSDGGQRAGDVQGIDGKRDASESRRTEGGSSSGNLRGNDRSGARQSGQLEPVADGTNSAANDGEQSGQGNSDRASDGIPGKVSADVIFDFLSDYPVGQKMTDGSRTSGLAAYGTLLDYKAVENVTPLLLEKFGASTLAEVIQEIETNENFQPAEKLFAKELTRQLEKQKANPTKFDAEKFAEELSGKRDYLAPAGSLTRAGSWRETAKTNLEILELVKTLQKENRLATPEEQQLLVKFTGWGASEIANNLFPGTTSGNREIKPDWARDGWKDLAQRAKDLFTPEELQTALRSTQYAHYTSESIIRGIWDALKKFGFENGAILEPGMGVGLFAAAAPADVMKNSRYTGIEMDAMTAAIAKQVLQKQAVIAGDYVKQKLPNDFFDVAIGNPPFSSTKILDDPAYKKQRFMLHDYFFAKSIDKVRPGGLLIFVTSKGTMDKGEQKMREYIADRADLLGAIRLPQTAFKQNAGTEVVTDVIFLRKRLDGEPRGGQNWIKRDEITAKNKAGEDITGLINEYFVKNPEMVLGTNSFQGSMYRANEYTVEPVEGNIEDLFKEAIEKLPSDVYTKIDNSQQTIEATAARDWDPKAKKEGSLYLHDDGRLMRREMGSGVALSQSEKISAKEEKWLKSYVDLRVALKQAQTDQLNEGDWESSLAELNRVYDDFVKKHGNILSFTVHERVKVDEEGVETREASKRYKNSRLLRMDVEAPLVEALERITEDNQIVKAPMLLKRTINKPKAPEVRTLSDALAVSLDQLGKLNLQHVAQTYAAVKEMSVDQIAAELGDAVFQVPGGDYQLADEYLSGFVVDKLEEAETAAQTDPKFERNVAALLKVQPKPLETSQISVGLGAAWIPETIVSQFAQEVLEFRANAVSFNALTNTWTVEGAEGAGSRNRRSAAAEWGTADRSPHELLDAALNNKSIKVYDYVNKKQVLNEDASAKANDVVRKMREGFRGWIWTDGKRASELTYKYNYQFNNIAPRAFDGSHLTLPGLSSFYKLHPHQKRAVWRILQTGNTYLAHAVGAGKTLEMIVSGMEQKRLGLINKPMYVVPRHMLKQFASEFLDAYPLANILVADEKNFAKENRRKFVAQAALNDLDAVIIPHTAFGLIKTRQETSDVVVNEMVSQLNEAINELDAEDRAQERTIKKLQARIETIERRFSSKTDDSKQDNVIDFEELGVDFLYVDEAHEFRKLDFVTNRDAVKGITPEGSRRALDLLIKLYYLEKLRPGRSSVLASGTPITNTLAELYTIMRFQDPAELEAAGLSHFDAWAGQFGEVVGEYEMNAAGKYELVERFSRFINIPELMKRVRKFMDVLTLNQLGSLVDLPPMKGGAPEVVIVPASEATTNYLKTTLDERIRISREWKPSKDQPGNPDPLINIITDGRLSAIDMRFVHPQSENDPNSKLNKMIDQIIAKHNEYKDLEFRNKVTGEIDPIKGAAQIVFSAVGFGEQVAKSRGFDAKNWIISRLVEAGIPRSEIAFMADYPTATAKENMFAEMRAGTKKILIGSPKNMGTGVNVQKRLKVLHFLSPPWYPADVEQPDGRIIRQGNQNDEIEIYRYATKGTYDSTAWSMIARKSRAIEQAMTGDDTQRTLEDVTESSHYEMASALAAGDARAIQLAGLRREIEKLERLRGGHFQEQNRLQDELRRNKNNSQTEKERLEKLDNALKLVGHYVMSDSFTITAGGKLLVKRAEMGDAIKDAWLKGQKKVKSQVIATKSTVETELAKAQGKFPIVLKTGMAYGEVQSRLYLVMGDVRRELSDNWISKPDLVDSVGLATRVYNALNGLGRDRTESATAFENLARELKQINSKIGRPFAEESDLYEKIAELSQLQAEMAADNSEENAGAPAAETETETGDETSKKARLPEIENAINEIEGADLTELLRVVDPVAGAVADGHLVDVQNVETFEILRRAVEAFDLQQNPNKTERSRFDGLFLNPDELAGVTKILRKGADFGSRDSGLEMSDRRKLHTIADTLAKAAKIDGTVIVKIFDDAVPHEESHHVSFVEAADKLLSERHGTNLSELANHPTVKKLMTGAFRQLLPKKASKAYVVEEANAWLLGGGRERLNEIQRQMGLPEITREEAADFLADWQISYHNANPNADMSKFATISEYAKTIYDQAERLKRSNQADSQSDGADSGTDADGQSGAQIADDEASGESRRSEPAERAGGQTDQIIPRASDLPETVAAENPKQKKRSLPETLRAADLSANDALYDVFGNKEAKEKAQKLLLDLGLNASIKMLEASETYDKTQAVMSFMVQAALRDEAIKAARDNDQQLAEEFRNKALELADKHAELATRAGQFIQAAAMVSQSVDGVIYHAQKIAKSKNKKLSAKAIEQLTKAGNDGEGILAELSKLKAENKRLTKTIEDLRAGRVRARRAGEVRRVNTAVVASARKALNLNVKALVKEIKKNFPAPANDETAKMARAADDATAATEPPATPFDDLTKLGASLLLDVPTADIDRAAFIEEMQKLLGNQFDEQMPQIFGAAYQMRTKLLREARVKIELEKLALEHPKKSKKQLTELFNKNEAKRAERLASGAINKRLANLYSPEKTKAAQELIKRINESSETVRAKDFAIRILTKEMKPNELTRKDRADFLAGEQLLETVKGQATHDKRMRDKAILGTQKKLRANEIETFKQRESMKLVQQSLAQQYKRLRNNSLWYYTKIGMKIIGEARSTLASGDLSASLRQGFYFTVTDTGKVVKGNKPWKEIYQDNYNRLKGDEDAARAATEQEYLTGAYRAQFKSILDLSENQAKYVPGVGADNFAKVVTAIEAHPMFDLMVKSGIEFAEAGKSAYSLTKAEENIRTEYAKKIPGLKQWLGFSERTYAGFLDQQRVLIADQVFAELFDRGATFETHEKEFRAAAYLINVATGRGQIGDRPRLQAALDAFGGMFFAPSYMISRFQLLAHVVGIDMPFQPPMMRRIAAKKVGRFHATISLPMIALAAFGLIALDADDDDFLKVRIGDKARYEFLGGLQPTMRFLGKLAKQGFLTATGDQTLVEMAKQDVKAVGKFIRTKLAPVPSLGVDWYFQEDFKGDKFSWLGRDSWTDGAIASRLLPISAKDLYGAYNEDGLFASMFIIPSFFGLGTSYYNDKPIDKKYETKKANDQLIKDVDAGNISPEDAKKQLSEKVKVGELTTKQETDLKKKIGLSPIERKALELNAASESDFEKIEELSKEVPAESRKKVFLILMKKYANKFEGKTDLATRNQAHRLMAIIEKNFPEEHKERKEKANAR